MEEGKHCVLKKGSVVGWIPMTSKTDLVQDKCFLNYFSEPPTLQRIAAISIAIRLWTEPDVINEIISTSSPIKEVFSPPSGEKRRMLAETILNRLLNSSLPSSLKTEISYVLQPVELQVLKCYYEHHTGYHKRLSEFYMNGGPVYWTMEGTVDIVKSLKEVFNEDNSEDDICYLYEAACLYCLEECLCDLWEKIPASRKTQFRIRIGDVYQYHLVLYWTFVLQNKVDSFLHKIMRIDYENMYDYNHTVYHNMVTCSIHISNISALKYFWSKLTKQERTTHLKKWLLQATKFIKNLGIPMYQEYVESVDVLCFLLSHVNDKNDLAQFFQNYPSVLMLLYRSWPSQRFFLSAVSEVLDYLQDDIYVSMMKDIGYKSSEFCSTSGYGVKLFVEIWRMSPSRLKRSFTLKEDHCCSVILQSVKVGDLSMAYVLFDEVSEKKKKQIISHMFRFSELREFLYLNTDTKLLRTFLSQTNLPPELVCHLHAFSQEMRLKQLHRRLLSHVRDWHICEEWIYQGNFQAVKSFLEWAFQSRAEIQSFKETRLNIFTLYINLLLIGSNDEHVGQLMDWYFEKKEEIKGFQKDFFYAGGNSYFKNLLDSLECNPSITIKVLEKLTRSCSSEEVSELKRICLDHVASVLRRYRYQLATMLLNWSLKNICEVKQYKNDFVLSDKGMKDLVKNRQSNIEFKWFDIERLIKWSAPLFKETVEELKLLIRGKQWPHFREHDWNTKVTAIFVLLDSVVEDDLHSKPFDD